MSLQGLAVFIMTPLIGWLSDQLQQRLPFLVWGGIVYAILQILLGFAAPTLTPFQHRSDAEFNTTFDTVNATDNDGIQPSWGIEVYALIIAGLGITSAIVTVAGNGLIVDRIPASERGAVSAIYSALQGTGNLVGTSGGALFSLWGETPLWLWW